MPLKSPPKATISYQSRNASQSRHQLALHFAQFPFTAMIFFPRWQFQIMPHARNHCSTCVFPFSTLRGMSSILNTIQFLMVVSSILVPSLGLFIVWITIQCLNPFCALHKRGFESIAFESAFWNSYFGQPINQSQILF